MVFEKNNNIYLLSDSDVETDINAVSDGWSIVSLIILIKVENDY